MAVSENIVAGNVMTRQALYQYGSLIPFDEKGNVGSYRRRWFGSTPDCDRRDLDLELGPGEGRTSTRVFGRIRRGEVSVSQSGRAPARAVLTSGTRSASGITASGFPESGAAAKTSTRTKPSVGTTHERDAARSKSQRGSGSHHRSCSRESEVSTTPAYERRSPRRGPPQGPRRRSARRTGLR